MMKKHYNEMEFRKVINLLVNQEQEVRSCVHYLKTVL